ncbi:thioesterase II family protein [Streptomyces sp. NPDC015139]|uniref:thioesterase II family protein n=1 Tax=Streptomyces sp. NPDC015139 TaxID=3364942 RepID=UPI0036FBA3D1
MSWIRTLRTAPAGAVRLVCLPHAGGTAHAYRPLAEALGPGTQVLAAQYPGRHDRLGEPPLGNLNMMAGHLAAALSTSRDAPLALFGHSFGALLAYEVAARLQATGPAPVHLFVSAAPPPSSPRDAGVHLRDDDGVIAELDRIAGTTVRSAGEEAVLRLLLPAIRADYRAFETYRDPGHTLTCPVTVLLGATDPLVTPGRAGAWARHTAGPCALRTLPGGHFYLTEPGNTARLARTVSAQLTASARTAGHPQPAPPRERTRT